MPGPAAGTAARGHSVISSGLRRPSVRIWALPGITTPAPSERYHRDGGIRRKTVADWAIRRKTVADWASQVACQRRRSLPERPTVVVADGGYAAMDPFAFWQSMCRPVTVVTRMRLDASLYEAAPQTRQVELPRIKGARLPGLGDLEGQPATG